VAANVPNAGALEQSNTGHGCFGRTVEVHIIGKDANFDNGGVSDACFVSAEYGRGAADLPTGSIYLYGPRRDLVPH
jgi:hypothetical protein